MPSDVDRDAADAFGLDEWSPDALDRLRRFVAILVEWQAAHGRCCTTLTRERRPRHSFEPAPLVAVKGRNKASARRRPHNRVPDLERGK